MHSSAALRDVWSARGTFAHAALSIVTPCRMQGQGRCATETDQLAQGQTEKELIGNQISPGKPYSNTTELAGFMKAATAKRDLIGTEAVVSQYHRAAKRSPEGNRLYRGPKRAGLVRIGKARSRI